MKKKIIRTIALSLVAFLMIPMISACGLTDPLPTSETTTALSDDDQPISLTIDRSNIEEVKLIRSDDLKTGSAAVSLFIAFNAELQKLFEAYPRLETDFVKDGATPNEAPIEIVIGDTKRDASRAFNEKLKAIGKPAYGISVSEGKLCVSGTSVYLTYLALDQLLKNHISKDESGNSRISLEIGFEWIEQAQDDYPSAAEIINSGREFAFYSIEKLVKLPSQNGYSGIQGGGSDGEFAYFASINSTTAPGMAIIRKYDMSTWELVATSEPIPSEHSNDITYDSKNDRLVISTCIASDGYRGIVTLKHDTLEYIESVTAEYATRGVAYLPEKDQYLFAVSYGYAIMNDKFELVSTFDDGFPNLTTQGLDCDEKYIFDPRWEPNAKHQTVVVHTAQGQFVGAIPLHGVDGEPENIICDGNSFIMGCNGSNSVFRIALLYDNWWE